ncbi:hypothetical protein IFM89_007031 [Coptis chinensis]|uniref:Uncharacterized protein n=1 Tax=Coptis chinensis TaxID=261450 RepID=A0A835IK80_9MAGN|nr:hypothetical protein IFM89_007031 [Coptis chinensis]
MGYDRDILVRSMQKNQVAIVAWLANNIFFVPMPLTIQEDFCEILFKLQEEEDDIDMGSILWEAIASSRLGEEDTYPLPLFEKNKGDEDETVMIRKDDMMKKTTITDTGADETERGFTIKSNGISLYCEMSGILALILVTLSCSNVIVLSCSFVKEINVLDYGAVGGGYIDDSQILGTILSPQDTEKWDGIDSSQWLAFRRVTGLIVDGYGTING